MSIFFLDTGAVKDVIIIIICRPARIVIMWNVFPGNLIGYGDWVVIRITGLLNIGFAYV